MTWCIQNPGSVPPNVLSKLYWSVVIPKMTYGMEIVPITEAGMSELEKVHRNNDRVIQNLPVSTPMPSTLAIVGWLSIDEFICMKKLANSMHASEQYIYRRIVILLMQQCSLWNSEMRESPVIDMFRVAHRYGMTNLLRHCYLNKEFGAFTARKSLVKRVVWEYEWRRSRASCIMYPRLETYNRIVNDIKMNVWWIFCMYNPEWTTKVSCVMAVLLGTQPRQMQIFPDSTYMTCQLCKACVHESAQHVSFYCSELEAVRRGAWDRVKSTKPKGMVDSLHNPNDIIKRMLSGLGGNYIREWDDIYKAFAQYIYSIYKTRAELYMPKNWDPQNEPAKSDCVITLFFFVLICVYRCVFL